MLLWLWRMPEATAPIRPLAWDSPYAAGAALEKQKDKQKKKKEIRAWNSLSLSSCNHNRGVGQGTVSSG